MKNILEVFPEGVIIESIDPKTRKNIVNFVNYAAKMELFENDVIFQKLDTAAKEVKIKNFKVNSTQNFGEDELRLENSPDLTLQKLLDCHKKYVMKYSKDIESEIEIPSQLKSLRKSTDIKHKLDSFSEDHDSTESGDFYRVKTIKVAWESSKNSYMHVFMNLTHVKNLEHERALNK